ncbi:MAG TPA: hypothetical protein PK788_10430, partial [Gemmatimonadaceae bacterium]|nr:hypothetical protein [Gemmatimonadaceae bacterium]
AHLAAARDLSCVLELDAIPCAPGIGVEDALRSGEEYELLVAAADVDLRAFAKAHPGLALTRIGRVEARGAMAVRAERGGAAVELPGTHDHFAR